MTIVGAGITTSADGYITGPNDGPGRGLGDGGERLHYWVFGGPWSYDQDPRGEATGADKELLDEASGRMGAVVGGRNTYEAAEAWGGHDPFGFPFCSSVTIRPDDPHPKDDFTFVNGLDEAIARAREAAGGKDVSVMGGADVIRQALRAGSHRGAHNLDRACRARWREATVRGFRSDDEPRAGAGPPLDARHTHHLSRRSLTTSSVPPDLRARRPDRRVLELPAEPRLRRAADRLRGGPDAPGGAGRDVAGG